MFKEKRDRLGMPKALRDLVKGSEIILDLANVDLISDLYKSSLQCVVGWRTSLGCHVLLDSA